MFRSLTILCLLNCVTETIQVLEGHMLGSSALDRTAAAGTLLCVCVWCVCVVCVCVSVCACGVCVCVCVCGVCVVCV